MNADGYLDLIAGSYYDKISGNHDPGTMIFWGNQKGFRHWDAQRLPGSAPVGLTVADFDADGFLDLFSPHYHGELTRESMPCYLYWGSPKGFAPRARSVLICDSPSDALAADFNRDGRLDLAVICHTRDGDHRTVSKIFYNDGQRFENPQVTRLPAPGPHWMWLQDMGHIYNRAWIQRYTSSIFSWEHPSTHGELGFIAERPEGTGLSFDVRSASRAEEMADSPWQPVHPDRSFSLDVKDRCLQYRATFTSSNGDQFPCLDQVTIKLSKP